MNRIFVRFVLVVTCTLAAASAQEATTASGFQADSDGGSTDFLEPYRAAAIERWEKEIQSLETLNGDEQHGSDSILFLGSSSIRRWAEIAIDMAPYRPIQRGYGGAKYSDVAVFAERLIHPHQYRALVMFVGNDVSGKPQDHTPEEVERLVRHIVDVSRKHQSDAPVLLIEVTPTGKRFKVWPKIRKVNARLREIALTTDNTYFVATAGDYLDSSGEPRGELFVDDRLHLNSDGYDLWSTLIRRRLDDVLRMGEQFRARETSFTDDSRVPQAPTP
jgi:hypothetical protein